MTLRGTYSEFESMSWVDYSKFDYIYTYIRDMTDYFHLEQFCTSV